MSITKYFKGSVFHTPTDGVLEYLEDVLICVDAEGMIERWSQQNNQTIQKCWQLPNKEC